MCVLQNQEFILKNDLTQVEGLTHSIRIRRIKV